MPEFNDLPNEVIREIVSYCTSSAVLQLRLVSQRINSIVTDSDRFKDVFQDVWIHLYSEETLKNFLKKAPHFPFQNFRIGMGETGTPHLFEDSERLQQFMDRCSASIRRLQVSHMYCGTVVGEKKFYESLRSLEYLEIQEMRPTEGFQEQPRELPKSGPVGRSMKTLKVLYERRSGDYLIEWIRLCPSLEVMSIPCPLDTTVNIGAEVFGGVELLGIYPVYPYVLRLGSEGKLEHLKILDLNGVRMELGLCSEGDRRFFHDLLTRRNDFRLKNVSADMLEEVRNVCVFPEWPWGTFELFKRKVVSTRGLHEMLLLDDEGSPLLEEVEFKPFDCPLPLHLNLPLDVMRLSRLKKIKARVGWTWTASVQSFVDRLFLPETPRETVVDLEFNCDLMRMGIIITPAYLDDGFPNLSRVVLSLDGFDRAERIQVIEVMSRKTLLEDLSLETRTGTPEEAFFGNQEDSPVLLSLKSLRKLSLQSNCYGVGCEVMGDRSLRLFARMSLTHLSIKGRGWETVTEEGIRALLDWPFGESVVSLKLGGLKDGSEARWEVLTDLEELAQRNRIKWS